MSRRKANSVQWWLAELDVHGNPTLIDGAYSSESGPNQAAGIYAALHMGHTSQRLATVRVEIYDCVPSGQGINKGAVKTINEARGIR